MLLSNFRDEHRGLSLVSEAGFCYELALVSLTVLFEFHFSQLTDVLLYTTPVGGNQYKLNKMLPLLGMQVSVACLKELYLSHSW